MKKAVWIFCVLVLIVFSYLTTKIIAEEPANKAPADSEMANTTDSLNPDQVPPISISSNPLRLWVPFDPKNPDSMYNIKPNFVFIQFDDLKAIQNAKNPTKTMSGPPPVNFQLSSASFSSTVKDDFITITGTYNIQKLDNEWTLVPVISDQVGLATALLDGKPAFITNINTGQDLSKFSNSSNLSSGNYYLAIKNKGNHQLRLTFTVKKVKDPSVSTESFSFSLPSIPIVSLNCKVANKKNLEFEVPQAVSVSSKNEADGTKMFATFPPITELQVKWNPKSSIETPKKEKSNLPPSITATTYSKVELGRGTLQGTIDVDLDIRHSALSHFEFYIPKGLEIDSIAASNNIDLVDPYPEMKNNILPIDLTSAVEGKVRLTIKVRKNFDASSFETKIPYVILENKYLDRDTGYVGVVETTNIETTKKDDNKIVSYQDIDSSELPPPLSGLKASIAFKYQRNKAETQKAPYDITINVVRHEDVAVYEANIISTDLKTTINEEGKAFTEANFNVTNTRKQFLQIKLPNHSQIWSVYVDGKAVKPAEWNGGDNKQNKEENKEGNIYSIPLAKSSISDTGGKEFNVKIVYFTDSSFLIPPWLLGFIDIKAIAPELATNEIRWHIYFPENSKFWPLALFSNLKTDQSGGPVEPCNDFGNFAGNIKGQMMRADMAEKKEMVDYEHNAPVPAAPPCEKDKMAESNLVPEAAPVTTEESVSQAESGKLRVSEQMPQQEVAGDERQQAYGGFASSTKTMKQWAGNDYFNMQQRMITQGKKVGKLPVSIYLPTSNAANNFYQISFPGSQTPYMITFYANPRIFGFLIIAIFGLLIYWIAPSIKQREFVNFHFIAPAILLGWVMFTLWGWNLLWIIILLIILALIVLAFIFIFTRTPKVRNTILIILAIPVIGFLLLTMASLFGMSGGPCELVFVASIVLAFLIAIVIGLIFLVRKLFMKKRKPAETDKTIDQAVNNNNMEGQNHE